MGAFFIARGSEGAKGGVAVRAGDAVDGGGVDSAVGLCGEGCDDEGGTAVAIESVGRGGIVDMKSSEGRSNFGTGTSEIQGGCGEGGRGGSDDDGASGSTGGGSGGGGEGSGFVGSIWSEKCSMEKEGLR